MSNNFDIKYRLKLKLVNLIELIVGIGLITIAIIVIKTTNEFDFGIILIISIFAALGFPTPILFLDYLTFSLGKRASINSSSGEILVENHNRIKYYNITDIKIVEIIEFTNEFSRYRLDYGYAKYFLTNGEIFIVTSFMTDEYIIPAGLKPIIIESLFPMINSKPIRNNEVKSDVEILKDKYKDYSTQELVKISDSKTGYRKGAIIAAKSILEEREIEIINKKYIK